MVVYMTRIPTEVIDHIREQNDIVEVISEYVNLKKRGRNYVGLCPFHNEKTPSFSVTEDRQMFKCFGCGQGGNVISFIREIETLDFVETIHFLAKRVGVSLPESKHKQSNLSTESRQVLSAFDMLTTYYSHYLKYAEEAVDGLTYFTERGITAETIERFKLGYAPSDSEMTVQFLQQKGFHEQLLVKTGLLSARDNNTFVDLFRGRVIFPIKNHNGDPVAFGGRAITDEQPKYLNSPEHELFRKGNLLYNYDLAKNHIREQNEVIVFEGYMDVLSADQAGIKHVIATLGTSFSESQAKLLNRYANSVILCFDSDDAGVKGSFTAATLLHNQGSNVKIATVPDGMDPDQYIKEFGVEAFKKNVIETSDTYFKFLMNYTRRNYNLSIESERIAYIEEITKQLGLIESEIEREYYINDIALEFNINREIIQNSILRQRNQYKAKENTDKTWQNSNTKHEINNINRYGSIPPDYHKAETKLLSYMLSNDYIIEKVQEQLGVNFNIDEHNVILTHLYALYEEKNQVTVSDLIDKIEDNHIKEIITEIAFIEVDANNLEEEIDDYIHIIRTEATDRKQLRLLKEQQKLLVQQNNPELAIKLMPEIVEIERRLKQ